MTAATSCSFAGDGAESSSVSELRQKPVHSSYSPPSDSALVSSSSALKTDSLISSSVADSESASESSSSDISDPGYDGA